MLVLGIESSCDETSASVVTSDKKILSNIVSSQLKTHQAFGGVVPEVGARAHLDIIDEIISSAMKEAKVTFQDLSGVAVTCGPGLIGGVMVGVMAAKAIAVSHSIPFLAVNHLAGHALTARMTDDVQFPFLLLLVSGGHTQLLLAHSPVKFELLGSTLDDAVGEAFDKTGRLMGLPYPSGPLIESFAKNGNPKAFELPRPLMHKPNISEEYRCTFSLSGLKTAARQIIEQQTQPFSDAFISDFSASFQHAIADILANRTKNAINYCVIKNIPITSCVVAGGVAANVYLRQRLEEAINVFKIPVVAPPVSLCTDNAAMIAWAGIEKLKLGNTDPLSFKCRPRWPLTAIEK